MFKYRSITTCLLVFSTSLFTISSDINLASVKTPLAKFSTSNIATWRYKNAQDQYDGLLIKVAQSLQSETKIPIKNAVLPYPRVINDIKTGTSDFAIMFNSPQANELGISIGSVVKPKIVLIAFKGTEKVSNLNELSGRYIGYLRGSKYGEVFDHNTEISRVPLESVNQGIKMLLQNRLYAVAATEQTFYYALRKLKISKNKIASIMTISTTSGDLYFSKASKNTHLIEPFRKALIKLNKNGVLHDIFYNNGYMPE